MDQHDQLAKMSRQLRNGGISRRDFVQLSLALGISAAAAEQLFTGVARAEPKKGGTFRIGIGHGATTDTLDPATYPDSYSGAALWGTASNGLVEIDTTGNAVGDLAESIEPSNGAQQWVFRLRNGVTFHDGRPLTANDVVASYQHHLREDSNSAVKSLLSPIINIRADGEHTVIFELNAGSADFPYITGDYHLPIMPANEDGSADWQSGIRTGAYIIERFEPGVTTVFRRNPNYHKPDRGHFDAVEALSISDVTARTNALLTGAVDYIDRTDLKTVERLRSAPGVVINEVTGYGHYVFAMNTQQPPFDNPDVRNAVKHSLDREDILQKVFQGYGTVGNDNPIAPTVKFAIDPQPRHTYDPDKVRELLNKAGHDRLSVDLSVSDAAFAGAVDAATLWQEHARAVGIDINIIREPSDGYWDNVWLKKPFCASYWTGRPTCDWMFSTTYAEDARWNETHWRNARFNELLLAGRAETDEAKRAAIYAEMQQIVHDDGGVVVLIFNSFVAAHTDKLAHGDIGANWPMDGYRITERWWFA